MDPARPQLSSPPSLQGCAPGLARAPATGRSTWSGQPSPRNTPWEADGAWQHHSLLHNVTQQAASLFKAGRLQVRVKHGS